MFELTEKKIQDILRDRTQLLEDIRDKRKKMHELMQDTDSAITSHALPSTNLSLLPSGTHNKHDLSDVMLAYQKELRNRSLDIRSFLWDLSETEEAIIRIWSCFCALPNPYYHILNKLYVEGELYQTVEKEFGKAHKTFENHRKRAMHLIVQYYQSDMSVGELLQVQYKKPNYIENKGKQESVDGQMDIFDILKEGGKTC